MAYITPITNRSAADIAAKNNKAYFNVAAGITISGVTSVNDWGRVYGNAQYVNTELNTVAGLSTPFTTITAPTTSDSPSTMVAKYNTLLANIEATRLAAHWSGAAIAPITTLVYTAGAGTYAPTYQDINQWETCIDLIKQYADAYVVPLYFILLETGEKLLMETGDRLEKE